MQENNISTTKWTNLTPQSPFYLFVPQDTSLLEEYEKGWKISEIFCQNGEPAPGIVTTHDKFAISWNSDEAIEKVEAFLQTKTESEARSTFKLCSQDQWQYNRAKKELADRAWHKELIPILYRPFDLRWTVYNRNVAVHRRERVMNHMLDGDNIALVTSRLTKGEAFQHVQVTTNVAEVICMSPKTSNNGFVFPLYLRSKKQVEGEIRVTRSPNLSQDFLVELENNLGYIPTPEAIFYYIYAIFHSPTYRTRYAEFLKIDFPRVPLTSNDELFCQLADYGEQLVQLHLMTSPKLDPLGSPVPSTGATPATDWTHNLITEFVETTGNCTVDPGHPKYNNGAVIINKKGDKFTGVSEEVWNFYVGGYQPCQKWLKDRKGRTLSDEDILHYQKIVISLKETIELMAKIDEAIPGFPIN